LRAEAAPARRGARLAPAAPPPAPGSRGTRALCVGVHQCQINHAAHADIYIQYGTAGPTVTHSAHTLMHTLYPLTHTTHLLNSAHYRTGPAHALRLTLYTPAGWLRDCPECPLVDTPTLGSAGHTRASTAAFARLIQKEGARAHAGLMRPGLGLGLRFGLGFGRGLGLGLRFGLAPQPWSLTWIDLAAGRA